MFRFLRNSGLPSLVVLDVNAVQLKALDHTAQALTLLTTENEPEAVNDAAAHLKIVWETLSETQKTCCTLRRLANTFHSQAGLFCSLQTLSQLSKSFHP